MKSAPLLLACATLALPVAAQNPLADTAPLEAATGDERSKAMIAGIDRLAMSLLEIAARERHARWKENLADPAKRDAHLKAMREHLRGAIGLVDPVIPNPGLQRMSADPLNRPLAEALEWTAWYVRWPIFDGVDGTGVLLQPRGQVRASVICVPDADEPPQAALFRERNSKDAAHHGAQLAALGCQVVVPMLISHDHAASGSSRFNIKTNAPHREWIYRQAFGLGRNITGYEVASLLNLVESLEGANLATKPPVAITGHGEGGWLALYTAALDERIKATWISRCYTPRENLWQEPLDRNAFNFVTHFGAAELGAMILPRALFVAANDDLREFVWSNQTEPGRRAIAAPFKLGPFPRQAIEAEVARTRELCPPAAGAPGIIVPTPAAPGAETPPAEFLATLGLEPKTATPPGAGDSKNASLLPMVADDWQTEQVRQLQEYTQKLIAACEHERDLNFWKKLPLTPLADFEKHTAAERETFWTKVIGRLPDPSVPANPRSRLLRETDAFTEHEVMLDVWPGVVAWGHLLLPKKIKPREKRPVVVCQHGLEGLPEDVVTEDEKSRSWAAYKGFAAKLAREGFITFAPHNFYRGKDDFRVIQRKLNLTGHTLFSVIIGQHQRILEWLKSRPQVDPKRIAFYGLSYGGKSAMRIPAVLTDYSLSICSADFNEWVRKCVSLDLPMSYVYTGEYEIWEWNLGRTFNYAEMAALIAPRPFMVERGHNDGVGIDEWVSYEYAKIRRLYNKLGIGDRTTIEYFDGPHTINGKGTFEFLRQWLRWPARKP